MSETTTSKQTPEMGLCFHTRDHCGVKPGEACSARSLRPRRNTKRSPR